MRPNSVSFIGLGRMGSEMAFNLFSKKFAQASDTHFVICDAVPEASKSFCERFVAQFPGAKIGIAASPEEAVLASQTIVTMLPSSPHVQTVYAQANGIIPTLRALPPDAARATLCIDSTTLDVKVARDVAADVILTGADIVDAPVSGGVTGAKAGTLAFMVGGTPDGFGRAQPTLAHMGARIVHCGPSGAGLGAKICNNLILGVQQVAIAEGMLLGQKLGLDPAVLAGVINSSTGGCWASSVNNPVPGALPEKAPPCERGFEGGFATALMLKDMGLATDIANETGSPLPLAHAAEMIYSAMLESHPELARKDFSSVYRYLSDAAGAGTKVAFTGLAPSGRNSSPHMDICVVYGLEAHVPTQSIVGQVFTLSSTLISGVLSLRGLNTAARAVASYLVPLNGDRLVGDLRMVDKFSVSPPTTYIGAEFPKILAQPDVEYRQANLTNPVAISACFDPPAGKAPYSIVIDFAGEVLPDRAEEIYINNTFNIARYLGKEAAKRKVKAYVRMQPPFYETSEKGEHTEKEDIQPVGPLGTWWHESLRTLASIEDWSPGKNPMHCIHVDDVAGVIWAAAQWMAPLGRAAADSQAGEEIIFHNSKSKFKDVADIVSHDKKVVAPIFNAVDDSQLTHVKAGETMATFFGTTHEFHNILVNTAAKFKLEDVVEDVNEHHVGGWTEMLMASDPPITNTPLSAYMTTHQLAKHKLAYDNTKMKKVLGYTLKHPQFNHELLRDTVDKFKAEGSWPIIN
ncbi:hypothetical protein HWV62_36895 [Athelia sp. TMB]|nr:hypothetical protein HWV62_36895 [Athelia sp. TMB]